MNGDNINDIVAPSPRYAGFLMDLLCSLNLWQSDWNSRMDFKGIKDPIKILGGCRIEKD
jgi:hypothetical protein